MLPFSLVFGFWRENSNPASVLQPDGRHLDVSVDVEPVVLGGEHHGAVVHERDVEALRVLDLGLEGGEQLPVLAEDREVEVVVVVGDRHLARRVDPHADRVVGDA